MSQEHLPFGASLIPQVKERTQFQVLRRISSRVWYERAADVRNQNEVECKLGS